MKGQGMLLLLVNKSGADSRSFFCLGNCWFSFCVQQRQTRCSISATVVAFKNKKENFALNEQVIFCQAAIQPASTRDSRWKRKTVLKFIIPLLTTAG